MMRRSGRGRRTFRFFMRKIDRDGRDYKQRHTWERLKAMKLPDHKTKIVCIIGPASESPAVMKQMIEAGMDVGRLNFSHGDFSAHKKVIENLRAASASVGRRIVIMADLSGPKMRHSSQSKTKTDCTTEERRHRVKTIFI